MNEFVKNITYSLILGGIWAVTAKSILSTGLFPQDFLLLVFYPLLFSGFIFISSFYFDLDIRFLRIFLTGLSAGLVYYFFSAYFPLLSILLVSAVLAAGFTLKNKAHFVTTALKGIVVIPVGIFFADLIIRFSSVLINHQITSWFILGAIINVCFMFTIISISTLMGKKSERTNNYDDGAYDIDDFRSQVRDIIKDLNSIHAD